MKIELIEYRNIDCMKTERKDSSELKKENNN